MSSDQASGTTLERFDFRPAKMVQVRRVYTTYISSSIGVEWCSFLQLEHGCSTEEGFATAHLRCWQGQLVSILQPIQGP